MALNKDLVAASATPLVLSILSRGESYGYAIFQQVRELSGGEMEWAEGMLYPILHRLEKKGLVRSHWGMATSGRRRKYYRISEKGQMELAIQRRHWDHIHAMLEELEGEENVPD